MAINADANAKNNHNQKCGASITAAYAELGVPPALQGRYFGTAGAVLERYLPHQPRGSEDDGECRPVASHNKHAVWDSAHLELQHPAVFLPLHAPVQALWAGPAMPTSHARGRLQSAAAA